MTHIVVRCLIVILTLIMGYILITMALKNKKKMEELSELPYTPDPRLLNRAHSYRPPFNQPEDFINYRQKIGLNDYDLIMSVDNTAFLEKEKLFLLNIELVNRVYSRDIVAIGPFTIWLKNFKTGKYIKFVLTGSSNNRRSIYESEKDPNMVDENQIDGYYKLYVIDKADDRYKYLKRKFGKGE